MLPKISIIILNWNGLQDTLECLESLKKNDYLNYEVVVVDNNSDGEDVRVIEQEYGQYVKKIIVNNSNLGFSGGNNVGINFALDDNCDVVLLLNNDTIVEPDFLSKLVETSIRHPDVGILTSRINYYLEKDIIWFAGGHISKVRASGFSYGIGKHERNYLEDRYCNFISGCCMYIKREVIERIGLLDENYFLYLEDSDYSYRAHKAGIKMLYASASKIYHKVSATTSKTDSFLVLYFGIRNRLYFSKKNFFWLYYFIAIIYLALTFSVKIFFLKDSSKAFETIVYAFKDMYMKKYKRGSIIK